MWRGAGGEVYFAQRNAKKELYDLKHTDDHRCHFTQLFLQIKMSEHTNGMWQQIDANTQWLYLAGGFIQLHIKSCLMQTQSRGESTDTRTSNNYFFSNHNISRKGAKAQRERGY
jgi:hypothetical protein